MTVDVYVETSDVNHDKSLPDVLLSNDESNDWSESSKDIENKLNEVLFINYASDVDDEKEEAKDKLKKNFQFKKENKKEWLWRS